MMDIEMYISSCSLLGKKTEEEGKVAKNRQQEGSITESGPHCPVVGSYSVLFGSLGRRGKRVQTELDLN
jgi:hypothetical protein